MFDEVQRICSQTAFSVRFLFNNAYSFFGYSASPWRDDGADLMIEAAMGHKLVDVTDTVLIENGFLVKPIIDIYPCCNNSSSGTKYGEIYKSAIVENPLRNIQICNLAYDDYSIGKNVLILVTQIKHGEHLESISNNLGMPAIFISGQSRTKKRRNVIEAMRSGDAQIVIATSIADVGLDVPRLDTVVDSGAGKSSVTALQRIGRIMRPFGDKKYCHFITIADNAPYIKDHIEKKIEIWKTESAFEIRDWRKT
jgi:superfamily II DNA or RNA helicase